MRVVDYKTGRAPREGFEAKAMFQMRFYALVLWRLRGEVPRLLQLLYLGSGEVLRYEPDEADLRATERKVLALWDAIAEPPSRATGGPARAGCATGATTRRSARRSAAPRPSCRCCPCPPCRRPGRRTSAPRRTPPATRSDRARLDASNPPDALPRNDIGPPWDTLRYDGCHPHCTLNAVGLGRGLDLRWAHKPLTRSNR